MMFKTDCPSKGWRYMSELIDPKKGGRFPMAGTPAEAKANTTGGEPTHNHTGNTDGVHDDQIVKVPGSGGYWAGGYRHYHQIAPDTNIPPFIKLVFCEKL
jgi:hypothetical protein